MFLQFPVATASIVWANQRAEFKSFCNLIGWPSSQIQLQKVTLSHWISPRSGCQKQLRTRGHRQFYGWSQLYIYIMYWSDHPQAKKMDYWDIRTPPTQSSDVLCLFLFFDAQKILGDQMMQLTPLNTIHTHQLLGLGVHPMNSPLYWNSHNQTHHLSFQAVCLHR